MNETTVIKGREMFGIVMVTCPLDFVEIITTSLLKKRLAAAINILPTIHSWYWWENSIHSTKEALLLVKTLTSEFPKLEQTVKELHPWGIDASDADDQNGHLPNSSSSEIQWGSCAVCRVIHSHRDRRKSNLDC